MFGDFYDEHRKQFSVIDNLLKQARMPIDTDLYLSRMTLATVFGAVGAFLLIIPLTFGLAMMGLFDGILAGLVPAPLNVILVVLFILLGFGVIFVLGGWGATYANLSLRASTRKRELNRQTPFAVTFMYALSRGGMNFVEVLNTLAESEDAYGEVSNEFESVIRDMDYLSIDLPRALRRGATRTPSDTLANFLDDMVSVIDSGADLTGFLKDKSDDMLREAEKEQQNFLQILALLGEVYVTAFVAGPLFLIIITVVMSMLGGGAITQLYGIVYGLLPLMNGGFFILIDTLTMDESGLESTIKTERTHESASETREKFEAYAGDGNTVETVLEAKEDREKSEWRRNPIEWMLDNPLRTATVAGPIALVYTVIATLILGPDAILAAFSDPANLPDGANGPVDMTAFLFVIPLVIVLTPISIFHEIASRREAKMLNRLPDALKQLASSNEIGMTLTESLNTVADNTSGKLGDELEQVGNDITWYNDVNGALIAFANRVQLPVVARTVKLITEANQSTGDIADVLSVAAKDVNKRQQLRKERFNEMMMYTVVVLISYGVYLFVIVMLDSAFLSEIAKISEQGAEQGMDAAQSQAAASSGAGGSGGMGFSLSDLPIDRFRMVFYHSTVIQAMGSGLLAGQLGKNDVKSGLKFSILLILVSTGVFMFL